MPNITITKNNEGRWDWQFSLGGIVKYSGKIEAAEVAPRPHGFLVSGLPGRQVIEEARGGGSYTETWVEAIGMIKDAIRDQERGIAP